MVRKVRQRVVDLADQQVLTVIETSHFCFHGSDSIAFAMPSLPIRALLRKSYLHNSPQAVRLVRHDTVNTKPYQFTEVVSLHLLSTQ